MSNILNQLTFKKSYVTVPATALALAISAQAMADVTVYGRAHVSTDYLDDGKDYSEVNFSSNSSRLGFKGEHEVNPKLKAFFQIEQQINFTTGKTDGDSQDFATRDTFVGLSGDFGAVQMGRFDSPFKKARGPANLFGDQLGDMRNLTREGKGRFDERYDNTLQYTSPSFSGLKVALAYSIYEGEHAEEKGKDTDTDAISLALNYGNGPFAAALAYEDVGKDNGKDNTGKRKGLRLAGSYKLNDNFKMVAFYQNVDYKGDDKENRDKNSSDTFGLGGEYQIGKDTALKAMWMLRDSDADKADANMFVIGAEHKLSKQVRVYANYALVDNDANSEITPWKSARSATPSGTRDEQAQGVSVGLRYDF